MTQSERKLLELYNLLDATQQQTVQDFLAFLTTRHTTCVIDAVQQPLDIPRPEIESVIKAIRRLRATFPMLDPSKLLHDTSNQLTRHMLQSIPAAEVIDELERIFRQHYDAYLAKLLQN